MSGRHSDGITPQDRVLRPGDLVRVRHLSRIAATLDANGTLDHVPFMPEMAAWCGQLARIAARVERVCVEGSVGTMRTFAGRDVYYLVGIRCNGAAHDGCGRGCMIYWKRAWLETVGTDVADESGAVAERLPGSTRRSDGRYVCQSSELEAATLPLARNARLTKCLLEVRNGNNTLPRMTGLVGRAIGAKIVRALIGAPHRSSRSRTPAGGPPLRVGDRVRIRPIDEIRATLDANGANRGLVFTPSMGRLCGRELTVVGTLDRWIDHSGRMRRLAGTVVLGDALCGGDYTVGGCPRLEYAYWRAVWLTRVD